MNAVDSISGKKETGPARSPANRGLPGWITLPAFALGLMVSPDTLATAGRFFGQGGILAPLLIGLGAWGYFMIVRGYTDLQGLFPIPGGEITAVQKATGGWLVYFPPAVRLLAAVFLTTGLTVSAGFAFNEVFVYWFPNFGFAFILLGSLVGLHFLGARIRAGAQVFFAGMALTGLVMLIVTGLVKGLPHSAWSMPEKVPVLTGWPLWPLLFFIGFDMAVSRTMLPIERRHPASASLKSGIVVFASVMALWAVVSTRYVAESRLAASSIPHMIAARAIGGDWGRLVMGGVIIAGTCAAVNALFETVAGMAVQGWMPRLRRAPQAAVLGVAAAAAAAMAGGLAGEERLDLYIRTLLLMWLAGYGLLALCLLRVRFKGSEGPVVWTARKTARLTATTGFCFAGAALLALTDPNAMAIFKMAAVVIAMVLAAGAIQLGRGKSSSTKLEEKGGNHAEK